jgi:heme-degrading monooxygenase HmoA
MFVSANRIFVDAQHTEAFETTFRNRAGLVDTMPGFISNQLLRPVNDDDPYIVLTCWQTRANFEAWVHSDAFRKGHAASGTLPRETFRSPSKLELFEVVLDTSRPDLDAEPA